MSPDVSRVPTRAAAALAAGLAVCVAFAYALAACNPAPSAEAAVGDDWTYVGDAACASCHADLTASTHRTGMGRAMSRFDPATAPEQFDAGGRSPLICDADEPPVSAGGARDAGYCYQAVLRGDSLWMVETHPSEPGWSRELPVDYVVGSGNATRSYLLATPVPATDSTAAGEYITQMPLTWYVERAIWDLSPGFEQSHSRFERPINLECMTCHNALPGHEASQNFYTDVPLGISCERCHGPASAHVEAFEVGGGAADDTRIVNPASLSTDLQLDVCQQCHLTGTTVFAPGEDPTTYRPGRPLSSHRSVFATEEEVTDPEAFGISSHAERMARSACFQASEGTAMPMTCTTCHDPHVANDELPDDHFAVACQSCHTAGTDTAGAAHEAVCSRPDTSGLEEAMTGDCASCHMRKAGTSDIPHVSFTDHWIQRDPPSGRDASGTAAAQARRRDTPFTLVEMTDGGTRSDAETDLALGMATFALYDLEHTLPAYLPTAVRTLRAGLAAGAEHPGADIALGRALAAMDSTDAADGVLAAAHAARPDDAEAALWLGETRRKAGRFAEAVGPLEAAVRLAPRYTEARLQLAQALHGAGRTAEAIGVLERALALDPVRHAGAWNDLGFYRLQTNQLDGALSALRRAVALDPRQPKARVNLGTVLLAQGDLGAAAAQFEAALRTDPSEVSALGNLGVARARQERFAEARRAFERLLAVAPGDARARAALDALP